MGPHCASRRPERPAAGLHPRSARFGTLRARCFGDFHPICVIHAALCAASGSTLHQFYPSRLDGSQMPNFATSDGQVIVIDKGGEQLLDNTYGFELEFCTHNSRCSPSRTLTWWTSLCSSMAAKTRAGKQRIGKSRPILAMCSSWSRPNRVQDGGRRLHSEEAAGRRDDRLGVAGQDFAQCPQRRHLWGVGAGGRALRSSHCDLLHRTRQ